MMVSAGMFESTADVAPVGRKDLLEKPLPPKPAAAIESSRIRLTVLASIARQGERSVTSTALFSGRTAEVAVM